MTTATISNTHMATGGLLLGLLVMAGSWWAQSNLGARLLPHGFCITGSPALLWLHVMSDSVIALAYLAIPVALLYVIRRRPDVPFGWLGLLFGAFIVACGTTHVMDVWTIWNPVYWYSGSLKAFTALVSVATAASLFRLVPTLLVQPSAAQLRRANEALEREVVARADTEKALQAAKRELEVRLQRTEVLLQSNSDLQQFAFIASHDLRSPLRSITGYLDLLQARYAQSLDAKAFDLIKRTAGAAAKMDRLTDGLLSYARLDAYDQPLQDVDCNKAVADSVLLIDGAIAESGATLQLGELPHVTGNASHLVQLFQNLMDNAIKYRQQRPPAITVSAQRGDGEWTFSVVDNGIGIDAQHRDRIFKIFERLHSDSDRMGSGIGLAVCQRIVERRGGRLWVDSVPGEGSTFFFTIPDATAPWATAERAGPMGE
ncbi:MAG: ATP-binding protein [Polaromonas sp.]